MLHRGDEETRAQQFAVVLAAWRLLLGRRQRRRLRVAHHVAVEAREQHRALVRTLHFEVARLPGGVERQRVGVADDGQCDQ